MKNKYQQDEFEQFLQDEVKSHRMYPSDPVWNKIRTELHGKQSWPALTFISLFIISALTISTLLNRTPNTHILILPPVSQQIASSAESLAETDDITPDEKNNHYLKSIAPEALTLATIAAIQPTIDYNQAVIEPAIAPRELLSPEKQATLSLRQSSPLALPVNESQTASATIQTPITTESILYDPTADAEENTANPANELRKMANAKGNLQQSTDEYLTDFPFVGNTPIQHKSSRIGFQVYATPSISFRKLTDYKLKEIIQTAATNSSSAANLPLTSNLYSGVNEVVRHRPALGLEVGFSILYSLSKRFQLTTGLQMNLRRYEIETFETRTRDLASMSLVNNRGVETISFYSPYNNNAGYRATTLSNSMYQISAPVGIQWKVMDGKKWGLTAEASVQPTFTLQSNTWLISSDYKHYTEGKDLLRKWNINTGAGINLTYQTRTATFSVGPQVRYQNLPTYSNLYPVRENLIDYGIRFSVTRPYK
jgi:hypothetical protein